MSQKYQSYKNAAEGRPIFDEPNLPIMHRQHQFSYFEGKILTLVETIGLPEKQESALKSLMREKIWDFVTETGLIVPDSVDQSLQSQDTDGDVGSKK